MSIKLTIPSGWAQTFLSLFISNCSQFTWVLLFLFVVFLDLISSDISKFSGFYIFHHSSYVIPDITPCMIVYPPPPRDSEISEFSAFSILGLSSATTWPKSGHSEDEGKTSSRNVRINFTLHCINTRKSVISSVMLYPEYLYLFIFFHINV